MNKEKNIVSFRLHFVCDSPKKEKKNSIIHVLVGRRKQL